MPVGYTNWANNQPDNNTEKIEGCVAILKGQTKWHDYFCSTPMRSLCEYISKPSNQDRIEALEENFEKLEDRIDELESFFATGIKYK